MPRWAFCEFIMKTKAAVLTVFFLFTMAARGIAETTQQIVDIPTRSGVSQRVLVITPQEPKAALILFAGGHGGLQLSPHGSFRWGEGNFLVRTRQLFVEQGFAIAIVDSPSDRQSPPFLAGFRLTSEHAADIKAVIAWLRQRGDLPVWLVGTSRGTQSAAHVATRLTGPEGADGLVLTATILSDDKERAVPALPVENIRMPVLVVHHENDGCKHCPFSEAAPLLAKLTNSPRKELLSFKGGTSSGDPCQAFSHHGFKGLESEVVAQIAKWIMQK